METIWATWWQVSGGDGSGLYPLAAARLEDGSVVQNTTIGAARWIDAAEAPSFERPPVDEPMRSEYPGRLESPEPDTVRVGEHTFLLVNPFYTETVTLQGDTVWVLDATLGEERVEQDLAWIERLFGPDHPVAVVVTDLAWPHISGVRSWVARGATIVSHRASEDFLQRVVERRWTVRPDILETRRREVEFAFRPVGDSLAMAGGDLVLYTIGGLGSETALMAWIPGLRYLWASDYIQTLGRTSAYGREVFAAVRRVEISPRQVGAQHIPLTDWAAVEAVNAMPVGGRGPG